MPPRRRGGDQVATADQLTVACDLQQEAEKADPGSFGHDIVMCLMKKGFCVIESTADEDELKEMMSQVTRVDREQRFARTCDEVAGGLLGAAGSLQHAALQEVCYDDPSSPHLQQLDEKMLEWASLLQQFTDSMFGFELTARSDVQLLEAGPPSDVPPPQLSPVECMKWLNIFEYHRLMCIFFIGPATGVLEMQPFDGTSGSHQVQARPGTWVILRADMLSHTFTAASPSYTLSSFFLESFGHAEKRRTQATFPLVPAAQALEKWLSTAGKAVRETEDAENELGLMQTREVQRMVNHMFHKGQLIAVRGWASRVGGNCFGIYPMRSALAAGTDGAETVPFLRWNNDLHYEQESQDGDPLRETYYCQHGAFVDGVEMFDNKFFGLSLNESGGMDPNQRVLLEVCYEVGFNAGMKKASLMKSNYGVFTGGPGSMLAEFNFVPKDASGGGALGATSSSAAILSNRISYQLGLNGPNFLLDLDGASSLMAVNAGADACSIHKPQCDGSFALGIDTMLAARGFSSWCLAGLMSRRGRCLTFDQTADGFIRGEGGAGVFMSPIMHKVDGEYVVDERVQPIGLIGGVWASNAGKVASLSAPNGALDQELIASAVRTAEVSPLDIECVECNGTGGLLNDAVEVTALSKAYRSDAEQEMLGLGSVKSGVGDGKPLAGMISVIKTFICQSMGNLSSTVHLNRISPHMLLDDMPVYFATDAVPHSMNSSFHGVTAKGYGGSCVHAVLWGKVDTSHVKQPTLRLNQEPISFWPGGGGELDDDAKPSKGYTIVGTWSGWQPEPMPEVNGSYECVVTLGEHAFESFQIWLDGSADHVLHPGTPCATRDMSVKGPDIAEEVGGCYWRIDGQTQYRPAAPTAPAIQDDAGAPAEDIAAWVPVRSKDQGKPGDQYRVQLKISGQYRTVTWEKIPEAAAEVPVGKYFLTANWNDWEPQEMDPDGSGAGVYALETQLTRAGGVFSVVRDLDPHQTIYPSQRYADSSARNPVLGPDLHGRGVYWSVEGKAGDVVRFELQRQFEEGVTTMEMSWRTLSHGELPRERWAPLQYFIVGNWDHYEHRHKMTRSDEGFTFEVVYRRGAPVNFQILQDGDWNQMLYPRCTDAGSADDAGLCGPDPLGDGLTWQIGKELEEQAGRYEVRLTLAFGRPMGVAWTRKDRA